MSTENPPLTSGDFCQTAGSGTAEPLYGCKDYCLCILCLQISDKYLKLSGETENVTEGNVGIDIFLLTYEKTGCGE